MVIVCPLSTVISVQYAKFGRSVASSEMCPEESVRAPRADYFVDEAFPVGKADNGRPKEDTNCLAIRSLEVREIIVSIK